MAEDKKIHIDSDWKAQAQKEKEEMKVAEQAEKAQAEKIAENQAPSQLPPADFRGLVTMLATQAFFAMGLFPTEETKDKAPDLAMAKFGIDMLGVIEEKTNGNLDVEEQKLLTETLGQLRMAFVQVTKQ